MGAQANARKARQAERERERAEAERLPPWTPFQRGTPTMSPERSEALIRDAMRVAAENGQELTYERAKAVHDEHMSEARELWQNSRYTVLVWREAKVGPGWPSTTHLSIRRNDRECPREERWRDFQRIKSELVGPDNEGCELYPAEWRVADCANQFHIFVLNNPEDQFPFGFANGMRTGASGGGAVQRPFEG